MFKKKTYFIFIVIFLLLLAAGGYVYLHFFYDPVETVYGSENELDQVYVQNGVLKIAIDPRIELLSSIELTGGYAVLGNLQFTYKEDMKNYFSPYKDHEAVRFFSKISGMGFSYDAPPAAMLYLSQPPSLRHILQYNTELKLRARGVNNLSTFTSLSRSFAADTGFSGFYSRNTGLYRQMVQNTSETLGNTDIVKDLEDYYGCSQNSYTIILSPLSIPGGYGIRTNENKGHPDIYAVIGPFKANSGTPVFDGKEIRGLVWHEFSHSFINPITADNKNKISKYSLLYKPLERIMKSQAYGSWEICVNEHLVRAVTTRLAFLKLGQEEGQNALREEKAAGFIYLDQLCKKLEEYEKNRSKYKSLKDFFPEILKCFESLAANPNELNNQAAFEGPINSAVLSTNDVVIIVPTNEKDKTTEEKIESYAEKVKNAFFKDGRILDDKTALKEDLSNSTLIIYGTISGNTFLEKYKDSFPFRVDSAGITADKLYHGNHLRFITAYPNPLNNTKPMIIYTAQDASDIININSVTHGPTDYVVASGTEKLTSGNYAHTEGSWSFK